MGDRSASHRQGVEREPLEAAALRVVTLDDTAAAWLQLAERVEGCGPRHCATIAPL